MSETLSPRLSPPAENQPCVGPKSQRSWIPLHANGRKDKCVGDSDLKALRFNNKSKSVLVQFTVLDLQHVVNPKLPDGGAMELHHADAAVIHLPFTCHYDCLALPYVSKTAIRCSVCS